MIPVSYSYGHISVFKKTFNLLNNYLIKIIHNSHFEDKF